MARVIGVALGGQRRRLPIAVVGLPGGAVTGASAVGDGVEATGKAEAAAVALGVAVVVS